MVVRVTKAIRDRNETKALLERHRRAQAKQRSRAQAKQRREYLQNLRAAERDLKIAQGQSSGIHGHSKKSRRRVV